MKNTTYYLWALGIFFTGLVLFAIIITLIFIVLSLLDGFNFWGLLLVVIIPSLWSLRFTIMDANEYRLLCREQTLATHATKAFLSEMERIGLKTDDPLCFNVLLQDPHLLDKVWKLLINSPSHDGIFNQVAIWLLPFSDEQRKALLYPLVCLEYEAGNTNWEKRGIWYNIMMSLRTDYYPAPTSTQKWNNFFNNLSNLLDRPKDAKEKEKEEIEMNKAERKIQRWIRGGDIYAP